MCVLASSKPDCEKAINLEVVSSCWNCFLILANKDNFALCPMQLLFSTWIWQNAWEHLECPPPLSLCFWTCTHLYTIYNCINLPLNKHYMLGMRSPDIRDHRAKCSPGTIFIRCIQIMKVNLSEAWFFSVQSRNSKDSWRKNMKATYWQPNHEFLLMQFNLYLLYLKVIIYVCCF